jgi:hypothetical protein
MFHCWIAVHAKRYYHFKYEWDYFKGELDDTYVRPFRGFWYNRVMPRIDRLRYKPIYYSYFSRDCDMCESEYHAVFTKGKKAWREYVDSEIEGAEGPIGICIVTKQEYEEWLMYSGGKAYSRDRILEAYENGNGRSIYV